MFLRLEEWQHTCFLNSACCKLSPADHMQNRPFEDEEKMNRILIANYNSVVRKNDTVYLLGDICFRIGMDKANELIASMNGKKYLIRGNLQSGKFGSRLSGLTALEGREQGNGVASNFPTTGLMQIPLRNVTVK